MQMLLPIMTEAKSLRYCNCNCRVCLIHLGELEKLAFFQSNEGFIIKSLIRKLSVPKTYRLSEVRYKKSNFSYFSSTFWLLSHTEVMKKKNSLLFSISETKPLATPPSQASALLKLVTSILYFQDNSLCCVRY